MMAGVVAGGRPITATAASTIAFRASSKSATVGTSAGSVNKPTGTADGDILIACVFHGVNATLSSSGWTQLTSTDFFGTRSIFWKLASSEPASWTFSATAASEMTIIVAAFSGGSAIDSFGSLPAPINGNPVVAASITPSSAAMLVGCYFNAGTSATVTSPPDGMTLIDTVRVFTYYQIALYWQQVPSGATGARAAHWTSSSAATQALVAIK